MHSLGYYFGLSKQNEVLILTLIGICCTIFDASLLDLHSNLHQVWDVALDPTKFSGNSQLILKYLLSGIVLVRTLSVHFYLAFYIVMLWPAVFEDRPALLLPWLTVASIKCLAMGVLSLGSGMYTCFMYGGFRPACVDFLWAQIIDHAPSVYMWFCVLSYYRELKHSCSYTSFSSDNRYYQIEMERELAMRRRKARSLTDNLSFKDQIDDNRHLISVSTIENLLQHLTTDLNRNGSRSLDSLLGVMAAEAEKEELLEICDDSPGEEDESLSISEKTARLLKVTTSEIQRAKDEHKQRHTFVLEDTISELLKLVDIGKQQKITVNRLEIFNMSNRNSSLMKENQLRTTKSDKVDGKISKHLSDSANSSKQPMDLQPELSETELRTVSNSSSSSFAPKDKRIVDINKDDVRRKNSDVCLKKNIGNGKNIMDSEGEEENENTEIDISKSTRNSDFSCQASTLSKSILDLPSKDFKKQINKKTLARTPLTNHTINGYEGNNSSAVKAKMEGVDNEKTKDYKDSWNRKNEFTKDGNKFKSDGYTMEYKGQLELQSHCYKHHKN